MPRRSFLDDVNRLFDELVSSPWKQERRGAVSESQPSIWEARLPARRGDLTVAVCGRTVTLTITRQGTSRQRSGNQQVTRGTQQIDQQTFTLPEGSRVDSVEAAFEGELLRLRVHLRKEEGE